MKVSVFVGTSLDGFLARADDRLDFLDAGGSEPHGYEEFIADVDVILMGRRTFEVVLGFEAWPWSPALRVVVLSSRPLDTSQAKGRVEQMSGSPAEIAAALAASGAKHVYVDGGLTVQGFLRAGLVDRMVVSRVPVLIGQGIPLFGSLPADVALEHVGTRAFGGGLVQSEYRVVR